MSLCRLRTSRVHLLHRFLEAHHEQQQERRDADGDQREVPVEPEHEPQHADDRHQVDEDASVDDDAKFCTVATSLVIVESSVPVCVRS